MPSGVSSNKRPIQRLYDINDILRFKYYSKNKLPKIVSDKILKKLISEQHRDVTIVLEDGEIQTNKRLLIQRSEYFSKMLTGNNFKESECGKVEFPCEKIVMDKIMDYLISGCLDCSMLPLNKKLEMANICRMMLIDNLDIVEEKLFYRPVTKIWNREDIGSLLYSCEILDATLNLKLDVSMKIANYLVDKLYCILRILENHEVNLSDPVILALVLSTNSSEEFEKFKFYLKFKDTTFAGKDIPKFQLGKISVEDLEGEVTDSGLYDEMTILEAIVERQREMLNTNCYCDECSMGECDCEC